MNTYLFAYSTAINIPLMFMAYAAVNGTMIYRLQGMPLAKRLPAANDKDYTLTDMGIQ